MTISGTGDLRSSSLGASLDGGSSFDPPVGQGQLGASYASHVTGIDRYLAPPTPMQRSLTPVEQGEAARAADAAADVAKTAASKSPAAAASKPHHPIHVGSTTVTRRDGTHVTTVHIEIQANFRIDGGTLPKGRTAKAEATAIERGIERDFSHSYRDSDGSVTRYVTDVNMTVGQPARPGREQFVYVAAKDTRLGGGLGIAPGFEKGRTVFISDKAGARTAPHEFGHLAGLRHTAQVSLGCTTAPGISVDNLMSQTGCSPTSQQIERSQLRQIAGTPDFR